MHACSRICYRVVLKGRVGTAMHFEMGICVLVVGFVIVLC